VATMRRVLGNIVSFLCAGGVVLGGTGSPLEDTTVECELRDTSTSHPEVILIVTNGGKDRLSTSGAGLEIRKPGSLAYSYVATLPDLSVERLGSGEVCAMLLDLQYLDDAGRPPSVPTWMRHPPV